MEDSRLGPTARKAYDALKDMAIKRYGSTQCSVISICKCNDPGDVKARRVDGRRNECTRFMGECAKVLGEVLIEVEATYEVRTPRK